ncbi:RNA-binding protein [Bacillus mycoides]|uniref:RNA-binding protein n=1 Tax=Bacillus mycoides TaxID=1405 RepID=UPI00211312FD|nr:RNA-binding protein [Bacillus mycoides]MCQ6530978.1 RNA-binding protein [Bacillus mycoides]
MKDSLREVLQDGIGDKVKCVSEEIETYGRKVNQTLKNMDWEIREPIQKHGLKLEELSKELKKNYNTHMWRSTFRNGLVTLNLFATPILIIIFLVWVFWFK